MKKIENVVENVVALETKAVQATDAAKALKVRSKVRAGRFAVSAGCDGCGRG